MGDLGASCIPHAAAVVEYMSTGLKRLMKWLWALSRDSVGI